MTFIFRLSSLLAVAAALMAISRLNAIHALLYLIVSLLSLAIAFFALGAPFAAALQAIVYAGAIMVLFVFVIMMLNLGPESTRQERLLLKPSMWIGPSILSAVLLIELIFVLYFLPPDAAGQGIVAPKQVGVALYGPYLIGVELAGMLLLAGLIGAYHLGREASPQEEKSLNPATMENE